MYIKLAWRNLWRNNRRTLITVASVLFAVLLSLFVGSMNRGMHDLMIENMAKFHTGYIQIQDPNYEDEPSLDHAFYYDDSIEEEIRNSDPDIQFTIPRIETFMLAAGDEITRGAMVLGIDAEKEDRLNELKERLIEGSFFESDKSVVMGEGLARRLELAVGDTLVLLGQGRFGMTAAGKYAIGGLMKHPLPEMNNQIVYMALSEAQWLLSADDRITALLVTPAEVSQTGQVTQSLKSLFTEDELRVLRWEEMMPELLQAIEFDQAQQAFTLGILYVVIGFGIFGTILMMTLERMREFAVLLSVGMQRVQLGSILFIETLLISFLGVLGGWVAGYPLLLYFYFNPIQLSGDMTEVLEDMELGIEPVLAFSMDADIFWSQGLTVFVISILICMYPVLKIMNLNIQEASRK
jgi:ABC-type lipoprotein release transport system permease subunit